MTDHSFPTLREVMKFLFNTTDIIPANSDTKKTIQRQLQRLAKEETELENNAKNLFYVFCYNLEAFIDNERVSNAIIYSIGLLIGKYQYEVKTNGACISREYVYRWLIGNELLNSFVFAQHKYFLMFNVAASGLIAPDDAYWWLPDIDENHVEWPLAKAFKWIYSQLGINQTHFHYPDHNDLSKEVDYQLRQNLENASNWQRGKRLPSLENLIQNLTDSLQALKSTRQKNYRRKIDENTLSSFKLALFIALIATKISLLISQNLGQDFLGTIISDFKRQNHRLQKASSPLRNDVARIQRAWEITSQHEMDRIWKERSMMFWEDYEGLFTRNIPTIQAWQRKHAGSELGFSELRFLTTHMGSFYAGQYILQVRNAPHQWYPKNFHDYRIKGMKLKNSGMTTKEAISDFSLKLANEGLEPNLGWLKNWIWGAYFYREENWEEAFPYFRDAFEHAKYSAGESQYKLVNQYIEVCAKNNKWREFKKGVYWAKYLGLEIRWLRNTDGNEVDMRETFNLMKKLIYPIL